MCRLPRNVWDQYQHASKHIFYYSVVFFVKKLVFVSFIVRLKTEKKKAYKKTVFFRCLFKMFVLLLLLSTHPALFECRLIRTNKRGFKISLEFRFVVGNREIYCMLYTWQHTMDYQCFCVCMCVSAKACYIDLCFAEGRLSILLYYSWITGAFRVWNQRDVLAMAFLRAYGYLNQYQDGRYME